MNQLQSDAVKNVTKKVWGTNPAGWTHAPACKTDSKTFFDTVLEKRFAEELPWLPDVVNFQSYAGKKVLEIGCGAGYDAYHFCKNGAVYTGIDLVPENKVLATKHLRSHGYEPAIYEMDAEKMQLPDTFDFIYSFGVLHHTPHIKLALQKSFEHLNDNGKVLFIVYHRNSVFYWVSVVLLNWILKGKFLKEPLSTTLSRIEVVGSDELPWVYVYSKKEFKTMMENVGFKVTKMSIRKLDRENFPSLKGLLTPLYTRIPQSFFDRCARWWGWYLCVEAIKGKELE